jgi:mannose-1-phosphate guanylyltransferase
LARVSSQKESFEFKVTQGKSAMKQQNIYFVILAGGKGERLWPLSRSNKPKQLLPFLNNQSLLEQTITRIQALTTKEYIWVVTTQEQQAAIAALVGDCVGNIVGEPCSKNTAPALLLTCLMIEQRDPQALVVFLPADHSVLTNEDFCKTLQHAITTSTAQQAITLIGVKPQNPATGYGYIEYTESAPHTYKIVRFHEKPDHKRAQLYYKAPNMLWNIGIFCAPSSVFLAEYKTHAPDMYRTLCEYMHAQSPHIYESLESISVDYAIMEKSKQLYVAAGTFTWSDVGNLETFLSLQGAETPAVALHSSNNVIAVKDKLVALININNMCIVETDDVLLVVPRSDVEHVKTLLSYLKSDKLEHYL